MSASTVLWALSVFLVFHGVTARVKRDLSPQNQGTDRSYGVRECTSNEDCPIDRACVSQLCEDPCLTFCGNNTYCHMSKHFPMCFCYPGYTGNPFEGCHKQGIPECISNEDCAVEKMCVSQRCKDPCLAFCGANTICQVTKHIPVCSCMTGYIGNPIERCHKPGMTKCMTNDDCAADNACISQLCQDPCLNICGNNTVCHVTEHIPVCSCNAGFTGNAIEGCHKSGLAECITNEDCPAGKACISLRCKDPCLNFCGNNTNCHITKHFPVCSCLSGCIGNPIEGCNKPGTTECISNEDCPADRMCVAQRCENPCLTFCGNNTACHVTKHFPVCSCLTGYVGNPIEGCQMPDCPCTNNSTAVNTEVKKKKTYHLENSKLVNWNDALKHCQGQNGSLATITSKEENDEIASIIIQSSACCHYWIGGTDIAREGHWTWISSGQPIENYTNWDDNEPSNAEADDCLLYVKDGGGIRWEAVQCTSSIYFFCEY